MGGRKEIGVTNSGTITEKKMEGVERRLNLH